MKEFKNSKGQAIITMNDEPARKRSSQESEMITTGNIEEVRARNEAQVRRQEAEAAKAKAEEEVNKNEK